MHIWVWVESNVIVHRGQSTTTATTIPLCYLLCITNAEHSILTVMHRLTSQELHNNPSRIMARNKALLQSGFIQPKFCVCVGGGGVGPGCVFVWVGVCVDVSVYGCEGRGCG